MSNTSPTLRFTETHEWFTPSDTEATVGISDHAQQSLGDIVFVELPEVGAEVSLGEEAGVIESVKAAADFYAPISGTIIAINEDVINDPALINRSPLDDGWLIKIKPNNPSELENHLSETQYTDHIKED